MFRSEREKLRLTCESGGRGKIGRLQCAAAALQLKAALALRGGASELERSDFGTGASGVNERMKGEREKKSSYLERKRAPPSRMDVVVPQGGSERKI